MPLYAYLPVFAAGLAITAVACSGGSRVDAQEPATPTFDSVRLVQGPCFGTCPAFSLTVFLDGLAEYDGRQYTKFRGEHLGRVSGDTLEQITARAGRVLAQADTLPRRIESGIADISQRTVTVFAGGQSYEFIGDVQFAEPVAELLTPLQAVAASEEWAPAPGTPAPPPSEVVVVLTPTADLSQLRGEFYRQSLQVVDTLTTTPPTYRLSFDPYTMTAEEMLRDLGNREDVVEVKLPQN